jgi:hypothetical protein
MKEQTFWLLVLATLVGAALTYGGDSPPGVWRDPASGLTWQIKPAGAALNWTNAIRYCKKLSLDGHKDWRLPTISEFRGLIRGCPKTQADGSCGVTNTCLNSNCRNDACNGCELKRGPGAGGAYWPAALAGKSGVYWSASPVADYGRDAWLADFDSGGVFNSYGVDDGDARCVR